MNVLVIGLGSMGKRRIKLLQKFRQVIEIIGIDKREDRRIEIEKNFGCRTYSSMEAACKKELAIQCVFVCTSPLSHSSLIFKALKLGFHVFSELNLVSDGYKQNIALANQKKKLLFLSSTHFYREEIKFIREKVRGGENLNYIYHVGQYLPDWHPWERFNDFFVVDKRTNGCREIMAIELPWIIYTFGKVKTIHAISDNISKLSIQYRDNYIIQLEHDKGNKGVLVVDIVSPKAVRNLEVYGEDIYYCWGGTPASLRYFDETDRKLKSIHLHNDVEKLKDYRSFVIENAYHQEIQEFFDILEGKKEMVYGFQDDLETLGLIDQIERTYCG